MRRIIRSGDLQPSSGGTITFEGDAYGSGVSFFHVKADPGSGPPLHRHPYSETWLVRTGRALMTADGEEVEVGPGDIAVVGPRTPHKFRSIGDETLEIVCIHASPVMIQENLE